MKDDDLRWSVLQDLRAQWVALPTRVLLRRGAVFFLVVIAVMLWLVLLANAAQDVRFKNRAAPLLPCPAHPEPQADRALHPRHQP